MVATLMRKISFLVAAHNEEKIIRTCLESLENLPYPNYEVVLGLDGCTDHTQEIVKEFTKKYPKIFRYILLNERTGKTAVVNKLMPHMKGDIVIINDADWKLVATKKDLEELNTLFDNLKLGGIAESRAMEMITNLQENKSLWLHTVAQATQIWLDYMIKTQTKEKKVTKMRFPFLVNIFRKELFKENKTLSDDFERPYSILENGYDLGILPQDHLHREAIYTKVTFKDMYKIRMRTAKARKQLRERNQLHATFCNFYLPLQGYFLLKWILIRDWRAKLGLPVWFALLYLSMIKNWRTKDISTTKEWQLRAQRQ